MPSDRTFSVYMHTNITNGKIYIGITKQKPERRWQKGSGYSGTYFGNAIAKYGWDGFTHEVLKTGLTKEEASRTEMELIAKHKSNQREFGYNISDGGYNCDCIGHMIDENHPNHQRVKMIDKNTGEVLKIFGSQSGAARELGISRKGITKACQGKRAATYKGYIWEYADKDYKKPSHNGPGNYDHSKLRKRIKLIETDGRELCFDSIKEAAEITGVKSSSISRYILGYRFDKSGRRWCYA